MSDYKILQSINYGTLSFAIFERQAQFGAMKSYVFSKNIFNKETRQSEKVGSFQLENFIDLSLIKALLKSYQKEPSFLPYGIMKVEDNNIYSINKAYKDKNGNQQVQCINLTIKEIYALIDFIERIQALNIKPHTKDKANKSSNSDFIEDIKEEKIAWDEIDDDIPF